MIIRTPPRCSRKWSPKPGHADSASAHRWNGSTGNMLPENQSIPSGPKRVLFVSYPFPPVGGAGVQRTTKFVKYLAEFGWLPSVLTVANPSVPAWDQSLVKDVPANVMVRRARTWEPAYAAKIAISPGRPQR